MTRGRQGEAEWAAISIRRDGNRPLRFLGRLIGTFDQQKSALAASFRLFLYKMKCGGYVILIDADIARSDRLTVGMKHKIIFHSKIDEICESVEKFDPIEIFLLDVPMNSCPDSQMCSSSLELLSLFHDIRLIYHRSVGQFLNELAWRDL